MSNRPCIAVAGPSGAGKSVFSRRLEDAFVLEMDEYFCDYRTADYYLRPEWDTPGAYDLELLAEHGRALLEGQSVRLAHYNFLTGCREGGHLLTLAPGQALVIEGLYAFLVDVQYTQKVYIEASFIQMVERCLPRDQGERGRTDLKKILAMYEASWGKYEAHLFGQRDSADLILGGDWAARLPERMSIEGLRERFSRRAR